MSINTLRPRQNGRHFPDDIFKCIFLNENEWISIKISLKFVPKGQINNIPSLVQIMAWRRLGVKPLSEAMMVSLLAHICVTRPQWVNSFTAWCSKIHYLFIFFHDFSNFLSCLITQYKGPVFLTWLCFCDSFPSKWPNNIHIKITISLALRLTSTLWSFSKTRVDS